MHFSTSLYLLGFLTLGVAAGKEGHIHRHVHRRHAHVDGPPNDAVVDVSTPPNDALVTLVPAGSSGSRDGALVLSSPTTTEERARGRTFVTLLPTELPEVPTGGAESLPVIVTAISEAAGGITATLSELPAETITISSLEGLLSAIPTPVESTSFWKSATTMTEFLSDVVSSTDSASTFATSNTTTTATITTSSEPASTFTTFYFSNTTTTSTSTTDTASFITPTTESTSASQQSPPQPTQTWRVDIPPTNSTHACFARGCPNPSSEMTYNKTVTFHIGSGGVQPGNGSAAVNGAGRNGVGIGVMIAATAAAVAAAVGGVVGCL